jgi:hypothetical protein
MRHFRDTKDMARALRNAMKSRAIEIIHAEALDLIAKAFGVAGSNTLAAAIRRKRPLLGGTLFPAASDRQ